MRALITNDDGIASPGLAPLVRAALDVGFEVVVAAPTWNSSGASASLTAVEADGRVLVEDRTLDGLDVAAHGVEAAPAFIARAAVHGAFGPPPDVVLSGVNDGPNLGQAVLHSGTVGAVTTAMTFRCPGIAFSIDGQGGAAHWETAEVVAAAVLRRWSDGGHHLVLNVNVPDVAPSSLRGLRPARLAAFGAVTANVTEAGKGYVSLKYTAVDEPLEPGTDAALISEGYATFTALSPTCEAHGAGTSALADLVPVGS